MEAIIFLVVKLIIIIIHAVQEVIALADIFIGQYKCQTHVAKLVGLMEI
jgi:hypothetical protein